MRRRAILTGAAVWLAMAAAGASSQARPRRIAFLHPSTPLAVTETTLVVFREQMRKLGYGERELIIEAWWGEGRTERLAGLATELVGRKPDVIVTASSAGVAAAKKATSSIPIVFATASNVVEQGFVSSLQRPGGNVTGVILYAGRMTQKVMEITREVFPAATRLAMVVHDPDPVSKFELEGFHAAASSLRFEPAVVRISRVEDLERAFQELARLKPEAVIVPQIVFFQTHRKEIVERALKARLPLLGADLRYADAGALIAYGTSVEENYRRAAAMVDKILRGAKPGELAVEQPERFHLVLNLKTARAIGVSFPALTRLRADKVIE